MYLLCNPDPSRFTKPNAFSQAAPFSHQIHQYVFEQSSECCAASLQGRQAVAAQDKVVAAIVEESFSIRLGGASGAQRGWGACLAARGDAAPDLRSQVGNALALKSQAAGLRAVGAVIYIEVPS